MKVLVTGAGGMLGRDLIPMLREVHSIVAFVRQDLDISDRYAVNQAVRNTEPDIVVNCAAFSAVDRAETERDRAFIVNGIGVQNLALACRKLDIPLCHISTDYVFNGRKLTPYTPFDRPLPLNVYGESKFAGEQYIQWILNRFYIIRTSWLYGKAGNSFVSTVLSLSREQEEIRVVEDQTGSPTSTLSLSQAILSLIETGAYGIHHFTDRTDGGISWFDFAAEIVRLAGSTARVVPVPTAEFPRPAQRPGYSVLDTSLFPVVTGHTPVPWKEALTQALDYQERA
ncbi:MAG: dTDP-4-dehydrorhamnose reductase [Candidatus Methanoperedens sp.]|nr:dTDP-4-dehydrorhamnose reductase [Candidatus Methanoperedens sp.]